MLSAIEATVSQGGFERVVSTATQNPVNTQATAKPIFVYLPADLPQLTSVRQQLIAIAVAIGKPMLAVIRGASQAELSQWQAEHIQAQSTHVDMAHALAHAGVLITHAGHSTVCQALLAGVPMVLIPRSLETRHTAIAAVNAGAAVIADMPEGDDSVINDLAGSIEQAKALTHPQERRQANARVNAHAHANAANAAAPSQSTNQAASEHTTNGVEG